ncbi:FHA domain-containing protein [Metapseudomonas otitidis]|uniref:FHA domain-containing protein n=1 Tax=Metapseudomonas otitidis TaxID=319939 RepID=UPI000D1BD2A3|nr:FHA domain-containing protein [Pseudomonas otitidis]
MLRIHFADNRQEPIWLADERFTIGQDERNHLVLNEADVSPFHAEIRQDHGHYYLSDCGTRNGTLVNGERIGARYQLRSEDRVKVGSVELVLVDPAKVKPKAAPTARWFLQVIKGENEGRKYHVTGSMTFGRSVKCELCFSDLELSRRHAEFFLKDDVLEIKDLASANGVYVNQQKVGTAVLAPGDQVRMASVTLLVIGPKVEVRQAADEDATQFVRVVDLPKPAPAAAREASQPVAANPLRAVAPAPAEAAASVAANEDAKGRLVLIGGIVIAVLGIGAAVATFVL